MSKNDIKWLEDRLPPMEKIKITCEADYYGASYLIASKLGKNQPPRSHAYWAHGWTCRPTTHPRQIARGNPDDLHLVATESDVKALARFGFNKVQAVGLPFVYVDDIEVERKPGSLLIMPAHSLPYSDHNWDQAGYSEQIARLKPNFSTMVACVHSSCAAKGYWARDFEKHGIPWFVGAELEDKNALIRISRILNSFEYMTTNIIGSHAAYAAYSGCKVSIYGQYATYTKDDYKNDPWYARYPDLLNENMENAQELNVRNRFPELFTLPMDAMERKLWGQKMLGNDFKRSPKEIADLLGWSPIRQFTEFFKMNLSRATRVPKKILHSRHYIANKWKTSRIRSK